MNVIHEVGGYVFLFMTDNLSVNQKMFKVYHKENPCTAIYSIRHPIYNPIFDTHFTLYDIRNNWVTEPSQSLELNQLLKKYTKRNGKTSCKFTMMNVFY